MIGICANSLFLFFSTMRTVQRSTGQPDRKPQRTTGNISKSDAYGNGYSDALSQQLTCLARSKVARQQGGYEARQPSSQVATREKRQNALLFTAYGFLIGSFTVIRAANYQKGKRYERADDFERT